MHVLCVLKIRYQYNAIELSVTLKLYFSPNCAFQRKFSLTNLIFGHHSKLLKYC
jgi:hypothetical protein